MLLPAGHHVLEEGAPVCSDLVGWTCPSSSSIGRFPCGQLGMAWHLTASASPPDLWKMPNESDRLFSSRRLSHCAIRPSWQRSLMTIRLGFCPPPRRPESAAGQRRRRHASPAGAARRGPGRRGQAGSIAAATASAAVAEGLRARIAYREAAGWLAHAHTWIHPRDLALRDAGLTGSYAVAALASRLDAELPTMTALAASPTWCRPIRWSAPRSAWPGSGAGSPSTAPGGRLPMPRPCGIPSTPWAGP